MAKISIIIPCHNAEKYIENCLKSVLEQKIDKEIICIDDCSKDNTSAIIKNLMKNNPEIRLLVNESNIGAGSSRNKGINAAGGEYISFMDSDDYYPDKNCLSELYKYAINNNVNICGGLRFWDSEGTLIQHPLHRKLINDNPNGALVRFVDYQEDYHFHSYIYYRKMIIDNRVYFPCYSRYEDPVFFTNAMILSDYFFIIPKEVYCYRKHNNHSNINVHDLLDGIYDVAILAEKNQLNSLKNRLSNRILKEYYIPIKNSLNNDDYIVSRLEALEKILNRELLTNFLDG